MLNIEETGLDWTNIIFPEPYSKRLFRLMEKLAEVHNTAFPGLKNFIVETKVKSINRREASKKILMIVVEFEECDSVDIQ